MMFDTPLYDAWHYSPFAETDIIRLSDILLKKTLKVYPGESRIPSNENL